MHRIRTFVAVDSNSSVQSEAERVIAELQAQDAGVRWMAPENIHLTLKFLGDVDDRELHLVCRRTADVAASTHVFSVGCRSLGAFPSNARPNTIWIGVDDSQNQLRALQSRLETELAEIGFPVERRPFKPHITLGRVSSRRTPHPELAQIIAVSRESEFGVLQVDELVVYSSELRRGGPVYTVIGRCPLASK